MTCLNVHMLLAFEYSVPYQLWCGNISKFLGVKMMKTVKCLSSKVDEINVHDIQKLGGKF